MWRWLKLRELNTQDSGVLYSHKNVFLPWKQRWPIHIHCILPRILWSTRHWKTVSNFSQVKFINMESCKTPAEWMKPYNSPFSFSMNLQQPSLEDMSIFPPGEIGVTANNLTKSLTSDGKLVPESSKRVKFVPIDHQKHTFLGWNLISDWSPSEGLEVSVIIFWPQTTNKLIKVVNVCLSKFHWFCPKWPARNRCWSKDCP